MNDEQKILKGERRRILHMIQTEEQKFLHALLEAKDMDGVRAMVKTRLEELDYKDNE